MGAERRAVVQCPAPDLAQRLAVQLPYFPVSGSCKKRGNREPGTLRYYSTRGHDERRPRARLLQTHMRRPKEPTDFHVFPSRRNAWPKNQGRRQKSSLRRQSRGKGIRNQNEGQRNPGLQWARRFQPAPGLLQKTLAKTRTRLDDSDRKSTRLNSSHSSISYP